ncbi:MAG: response regulator transcription factor [Rubrobacteraceae bacterium]
MIEDSLQVLTLAASPVVRAGLLSLLAAEAAQFGFEFEEAGLPSDPDLLPEPGEFDVALISFAPEDPPDDELLRNLSDVVEAVVLLSDNGPLVERAAILSELGLRGWAVLPLDASTGEVLAALFAASRGLATVTADLAERLLLPEDSRPTDEVGPGRLLTPREVEVLGLISRGLANKNIARQLKISDHTVKFHVSSIYTKLDAANRAEAVSIAARLGLITL